MPEPIDPIALLDLLGGTPWLDPQATSLGRLPMRPPAVPCPDASTARSIDATDPSTFTASP
jgi:hypothetical protein